MAVQTKLAHKLNYVWANECLIAMEYNNDLSNTPIVPIMQVYGNYGTDKFIAFGQTCM